MIIKYEFADGTVSEVEVSEELGTYITASRREEKNYERKVRYHCVASLDDYDYEGDWLADDTYSPERKYMEEGEERLVNAFLDTLTDIQRERAKKLLDGMTMKEIAESEGKSQEAIFYSVEGIRKKLKKFLKTT